jgi:YD repeat-containing protein
MSDRQKAGLRGPVKLYIEEDVLSDGSELLTANEYNLDGRLLSTRVINPEGSEWVTTEIYSADGRLLKSISGASGEPGAETLLTYDEARRLLAMTSSGGNSGRTMTNKAARPKSRALTPKCSNDHKTPCIPTTTTATVPGRNQL